jgi:hypothetical protein
VDKSGNPAGMNGTTPIPFKAANDWAMERDIAGIDSFVRSRG